MYHWEADQEDFLVVSGEALLIVEGEERPLRQWDFVHCPPGTKHTILGAGDGPCIVVAVGAREHQDGPDWGGIHGGRGRAPTRGRRGAGDDCPGRGVRARARALRHARADGVPRRLASASAPSGLAPGLLPERGAANICSYPGGDHPPRRSRRLLRVGRAAGRPAASRSTRDRRRRGRARRELRGEGVRRADGHGRPAGAAALPARRRRPAADVRVLRGEQGRVRALRGHHAARRGAVDRRGVPRRARARAARGVATGDRGTASPTRARARSGSRSRSASRGRSSSRRWRAASRSRTAFSSCRPTTSSASCTRCPSRGSGVSGA